MKCLENKYEITIFCILLLCGFGNVVQGQQYISAPVDNSSYFYNVISVALTASRADGIFSGPGVTDSGSGTGTFAPGVAGIGSHVIHYIKSGGGYDSFITINVIPSITFSPSITSFCEDGANFGIDGYSGAPAGGVFSFSGPGVVGSIFYPLTAGPGNHIITATYTMGGVSNSATAIFNVKASPVIELVNFDATQCQTDPDYTIWTRNSVTLEPINSGIYTGNGITDNGDGTALFSPLSANLGYHNISFVYTDINTCTSTIIQTARVGTEIFIEGLASSFCFDDPIDNFTYSPVNSANPLNRITGAGVIDNLDGTATFNPSVAGVGVRTITYTFVDPVDAFLTCTNIVTQTVNVYPAPTANFSGLNFDMKYCAGATDVTLTGNYAPSGVFSGDGVINHGNGTATFQPSSLGVGVYSITYRYINGSGCDDNEIKTVEILPLPISFNLTGGGTYCEVGAGVPVNLTNSTTGINYKLFRNGIGVVPDNTQSGSTGNPINFGNQTITGMYTVIATNPATGCSLQMTGSASVSVISQASITIQTIDATICETGSASFTIEASGQNLHYQWYKNGGGVGVDNNVLVLNAVPLTDDGQKVYCVVTSTCGGPLTSNEVTLTVNPNTRIITNPVNAVMCTGSSVTFSVIADGMNKTYQWKKGAVNSTDIAGKVIGSNSSSLTIMNLVAGDAGLYSCVVSGDCGVPVQSNQATLTVYDPISITAQPVSFSTCAGSNISFSTAAAPAGLNYQWWFFDGINPPANVGTGANLPVSGVAAGNAGTYYCVISSPCGESVSTNNVTLSIPATTSIITNPTGGTICQGNNFNFSVIATGSSLFYEWYLDGTLLSDGGVISNSNTANLTLSGATLAYTGNYACRITGDCGTLTTPAAALFVEQAVTFNSQPVNRIICPGSDASFSVNVNGTNLVYEWQKNNIGIAGATNPDYTIVGAMAAEAGTYRCKISNACGIVYSNVASLTVNVPTSITIQPANISTCENLNASFSVIASGTILTYQWYKNAAIIAGATNTMLNLINVTASDAASYTVLINGTCGSITSVPGTLTVETGAVITTHPLSKSVCPGMPADLTVVVPTGTNLSYQWIKDGINVGTDSPVYSIPAFAAADAGSYHCNITNICGTVLSNPATLLMGAPVNITSNPVSVSTCFGSIANFSVASTGSGLSYQWQKNGAPLVNGGTISGVNTAAITINGVVPGDDGNYRCQITNSCNTQTSTSATLSVSQAAIITLQPQDDTGCIGEPLNIVSITSGTNLTYQWYKDGVAVGINNPVYAIAAFVAGDAGIYRCEIANGCGTVVSDNALISTGLTTNIITDPVSAVRCLGSDVNFFLTATGTNLTYQWKKDGTILVDNARISATNTSSLSITDILLTDLGTYTCDVIGNCQTVTSNGSVLSVKKPVLITTQPDNLTVCNGNDAIFDVIASGDDLIYSWQKNGIAIVPAETGSSLVLVGVNNSHEGVYNCRISNSCSFEISTSADLIVDDNLVISIHPLSATQCQGTNVSFSVSATVPPNTVYQWYKDGAAIADGGRISGTGSAILNINAIVPADNGSYSTRLISSCGIDETDIAVLIVLENVAITVSPASFSVLNGSNANFTVVASGNITGYQWRKDGVDLIDGGNISGALTANLTVSGATSVDQGAYTSYVMGICNNTPSNPANLTVLASSEITTQPVPSTTICEGGTLNLFITTSGAGHSYQWKKDGIDLVNDVNTSGATTATLTISNLIGTNMGAYTCLVDGSESSSSSLVIVNPSTNITLQPVSATKCVNDNVTLVIAANGAGLTYQWKKNNVDIPLAVNSTYIINPLVDGDDGVYTCVVTGTCGSKTSNPATLDVNKNTLISTQPSGSAICEGTSIAMSVVADGDNLIYQWKKNGSVIINAGNISGTTTSTIGISNALTADAGFYSCTVTGACGSETSNFATLVVNPTTSITVEPIGRTKCEGDNVSFTVNSTGSALTYQWQKNNVNVINDGNITGASTSNLSIAVISEIDHQGTYTCIVTGTCGISTSDPAVLSVSKVTIITTQPSPAITICQSASTTISIVATGGILTYQWTKNGIAVANGGNISGATTNSLVISNALTNDAGFYNCTVTGTCGSETSNLAVLQVNPAIVINIHPIGQTLCENNNIQFTVSATGMNLTYQWKKNNVDIPSATGSTLTINSVTNSDAGAYTCVVTGSCGVAVSNPANLIVNPNINITVQPVNTTICEGTIAILSLNATGTAPVSYRWKYNDIYITDDGRITGATTNELRIALSTNTDEGIYKCEIISGCDIKESSSVILTVDNSSVILIHPFNQNIVQGSTAFFSISATGIITGYQWQKNGVNLTDVGNITGSATPVLSIANVAVADAGSYSCVVTGKCGTLTSNIGILTVIIPVNITTSPVSLTRCSGESASFSVAANGTIQSWQWTFNGFNLSDGINISGAHTPNLVIASVDPSHAGLYSCIVTGSFNIANSIGAILTVNEPAVITQHPITQAVCEGDWLVLEVIASGAGMTYQWEKDNIPLTPDPSTTGINASLMVITNVSSSNSGSYRCTITNTCKTEISNPAIITINPTMSLVTQPVSSTRCEGQTTSFSVLGSGVNIQYQWYKNGVALTNSARITGAITNNLTIINLQSDDQASYSCLISDNCSSINSSTAVLTIKNIVVIDTQPSNMTVCEGTNSFFEVRATGYNLAYQWQKDGADISDSGNIAGSNTSVLIINNTTLPDQGVYRCIVTGDCNSILTNTSNLVVNLLPGAAGVISGINIICQGSQRVLYVVPPIPNITSYVWTLPYGASIVSGGGTRSIEVDFSASALSGVISVHGLNGCASGPESPAVTVTVNQIPAAIAGPDQILCADVTSFTANATTFGIWTKISGLATIVNPDLPNSSLTGIGQGINTFLWTVSENGCTAMDTIMISNKRVYSDAGPDQIICSLTSSLNANSPTVGSGSWSIISGGGVFNSLSNPNANVINLSRGSNILRWSINNGGCISYDEIIVRNDLPNNADAGKDTIILVNNYTLDGNNPLIGTGLWTLLSGSATITNPAQYNTTVTNLGIGENIFQWIITNNLCYNQDEIKVINFTPTLTYAGPNQTLCVERTKMQGTKPNYGTGQWSVVAGSATFEDPYSFDTEVINIGKGQNIYRWTIYEYEISFDDVIITNNSPSAANAGIDQRLCSENAVAVANNPVIGTGTWTVIGGSGTLANPSDYNSVVSNLGSGSNTFRWTISNGSCSSYDEVVITNDQPTFAAAGSDQVICSDSVNLYPNTPTIGIGEWSVVRGSAFFSGNKAYSLSRGDNLFKFTISNNGCSHSDTVLITSNKPTASYTGEDKSICVDSVYLPGNTPLNGIGVWTMLSGSGTFADINDPKSKVTNLASGQNRFRWTITYNGCNSFSEVDISYNFIQSDAGGDQILCQPNALLGSNDPAMGIGQWSVVGGSGSANFVNPNQPNTEVTNLDKGMNILRWTINNSGCVSFDNVVITNNTPGTAYAGSDRSVCGEVIFLSANTPVVGTGEWSLLGGSANIEDTGLNTTRVSNLSIGKNTLRWTITNQNCISFDEVVINNDQPLNIEAGPSQYICSSSAQLYATVPVGGYGRWSVLEGSATFEDNTLYNSRVYNLEKSENKLAWTVTIAGCSNIDSVIIANNLPSAPSAGPDQDICSDNVFMAANQPVIGTSRWSIVSGSAVFDNITSPTAKTTRLGNGPNVLRWTITNGSCTLFDEVTILNNLPTVAYAGNDRAICNTAANLLATSPTSGTGSWSVVSGYGIFTDAGRFDTQINNLGFGPNTLRWTTENGRCHTSDDVIISNNLADVYAGPDQVVYNSKIRLVGNKPSKGTGQWIVLAGQGTLENPSNFETSVSGLGGGANTFNWTINNDGCIASDDVVITYRVLPVADFELRPGTGCPPLQVSFTNTSLGGAPYLWDFGDGTTSVSMSTDHIYYVPGNYTVRLTATGPDGIVVHKDTVVVVREVPVAQFEITPDTVYIPGYSVHFFNLSNDIDSLLWEFGDGTTSTEENPIYKYTSEGSYDVTLHVWSGYQCFDLLYVLGAVFVELAGIIKCPNAFTPNTNGPTGGYYNENDFSNDVFHCYIEGSAVYHLEIYNRLGIRLFESNDVNIGWDGYFKGKLVEEGSYVFKVYGRFNNGEPFDYFGNIILVH